MIHRKKWSGKVRRIVIIIAKWMKTIVEAEVDSFDRNVMCVTMDHIYVWQKIAPGVKEVLAAVKQTNRLSAAKKR
jgi:hypothetical protein